MKHINERILQSCRYFYDIFDIYPEKIGVNQDRLKNEDIHDSINYISRSINFLEIQDWPASLTDMTEEAAIAYNSNVFTRSTSVSIPYCIYIGIGWDDFVLYSEKTGVVKPNELEKIHIGSVISHWRKDLESRHI